MSERVVNLFLYVEGELIESLGATAHDFNGNDEQANAFLQSRVAADAPCAIRYPIAARRCFLLKLFMEQS
jgi:hypothetical protein